MDKRILLVDDEPQLLFSVKEYLCRVGYDVTPAESGPEALNLLVEDPPDMVISDIMMEEMDGFEFQKRVQALTGTSIPFVFLTARGELKSRLGGLRAGADDYVVKPFEPEELEARVATILSRVESTRQEERRDVDALKSRILAEMSSRLRVPVTSLTAHLNLLMSKRFGQDDSRQSRYLETALEDAEALGELIEDLSWASADTLGTQVLNREPMRIAPIVRGAAGNAARAAVEKDITLHISCGGLLSGNLDGAAMTRALAGLLERAVEVSPNKSEVSITARRAQEGGIEFLIISGARGQDENAAHHNAPSTDDALQVARQVVQGHGGHFEVRTEGEQPSIAIWIPGRVAKHVGRKK